jgi:hypothetical protein
MISNKTTKKQRQALGAGQRPARATTVRTARMRAQASIEMVAGLLFLIPILLVLVDIGVMMLASSTNDNICKRAARAAANQYPSTPLTPGGPTGNPQAAAGAVIDSLLGPSRTGTGVLQKIEVMDAGVPPTTVLTSPNNCDYDVTQKGNVIMTTRLTFQVPVPFWFFGSGNNNFITRADVPIVSRVAP